VLAGQAAGGVVFGLLSIVACYRVIDRLAERHRAESRGDESRRAEARPDEAGDVALIAQPIPPFNSGQAAAAIDWVDTERDRRRDPS
jgi:hypothetical protein